MSRPIFFGPSLEIVNPAKLELKMSEENFLLIGKTDFRADLTVKDEKVYPTKEGYFSTNIGLNEGLNIIEVKTKNRFSQETAKTLRIARE